jgi:hypothetical protein
MKTLRQAQGGLLRQAQGGLLRQAQGTRLGTLCCPTRADFLERTRRYGTLIVLGVAAFLTYNYSPPVEADHVTSSLDGYRGGYNSAWVGGTVTVSCVLTLSFSGFCLVKSTMTLDRRSGFGQIVAAMPLTKLQYILAKTVTNRFYLAALAAMALLAAIAIQLARGEVLRIDPCDYLVIVLPASVWIAALVMLLDWLHWLRGGLGSVLFFFLFVGGLSAMGFLTSLSPYANLDAEGSARATWMDPTGSLIALSKDDTGRQGRGLGGGARVCAR